MINIKTVLSKTRNACQTYKMIEAGDKIAVGLSGGKDSVVLLAALARLRKFYEVPFDIAAITLDPVFGGVETDYSPLVRMCEELDVEYVIKRTDIAKVVFDVRDEQNPCSLCARIRRGALHNAAKETDCNKLALGHHEDDAAETFLMNLFNSGTAGCFSPVTYMSEKDITVIRPLIFLTEKEIARAVTRTELPVVKSKCPADGNTERQSMKKRILELERDYPALRRKITGAMQRANISGWGKIDGVRSSRPTVATPLQQVHDENNA